MQPTMRVVYMSTRCGTYWNNATLVKHPNLLALFYSLSVYVQVGMCTGV